MPYTASIDKVESLSYAQFLESYLIPNRPLLVGTDLVKHWPAFHLWVNTASDSQTNIHRLINWDYLSSTYGSQLVNVTDCTSEAHTSVMQFTTIADKWQDHDATSLLYVKDWHLARWVAHQPGLPVFYNTPPLFVDDWLNYHYCTFTEDDFRFVYIGVQGTFTPFHKDVYDSYSWSTNVIGTKLWTFWFPGDAHQKGESIQVVQEAGETMFVPSGWYHTVKNLTTCISINHNWCNSVNLPAMYDAICSRISDVERELDDVKDLLSSNAHKRDVSEPPWQVEWMSVVQDVLEKDAGWNWSTFWEMVLHGLEAAIKAHEHEQDSGSLDFPPPCRHLQPPLPLVQKNVQYCFDSFCKRQEQELKGELDLQIKRVGVVSGLTVKDIITRLGTVLGLRAG